LLQLVSTVKACPHWRLYSRRFRRQFVAEFGDSRRFWRQSPNSAKVASFGNSRRFRWQSPVLASVDRLLFSYFITKRHAKLSKKSSSTEALKTCWHG